MNIIFDKRIDPFNVKSILGKLNDILYSYYPITKEIKMYNIDKSSSNYMSEVVKYKDIIMDPNKTPETYLKYIQDNIPSNYQSQTFNLITEKIEIKCTNNKVSFGIKGADICDADFEISETNGGLSIEINTNNKNEIVQVNLNKVKSLHLMLQH